MFLTAKHLEGCSDKTIRYYRCNIEKMLDTINIPVIKITTEMLRKYLIEYQTINNCGKVSIDKIVSKTKADIPIALKSFLERNKNIKTIIFHLDNDGVGIGATSKIMKVLSKKY